MDPLVFAIPFLEIGFPPCTVAVHCRGDVHVWIPDSVVRGWPQQSIRWRSFGPVCSFIEPTQDRAQILLHKCSLEAVGVSELTNAADGGSKCVDVAMRILVGWILVVPIVWVW